LRKALLNLLIWLWNDIVKEKRGLKRQIGRRVNMIKECPKDGNIRCINCSCYLCKNNCQEYDIDNCEPREIVYK